MLSLRFKKKSVSGLLYACCCTNSKYVNSAKSGKSNFEKDFNESHIETSAFQKFLLGLGSGFMSITDPRRGDMVAVMGESTGISAFKYIQSKMLLSEEGRQILEEKPRISSASVNLEELKDLPEGTLGKAYSNFLEKYKYSPDERLAVRFVDDFELAYVAQRYREAHDLFHTILDMPTNMLGEVTVKWVEAIQTRLPMCVTGALFGPLRLAPKLNRTYCTKAVLTLDPGIAEDIKTEKEMLKCHPGKIGENQVILPKTLEERIISYLDQNNALQLYKEAQKFKMNVYRRLIPLEEARRESMLCSFRESVLWKFQAGSENLSVDKIKKYNKAMKKYENILKSMSKPLVFDKKTSLLYLMARAPFEYSTLYTIFREISKKDPDFKPKALFDFGSGVGTVTWAASEIWKKSLMEYFTVDISAEMNDIAHYIIQPSQNVSPFVKGFLQRQFLPAADVEFDIVVSAFSFSYLPNHKSRIEHLNSLWNKTSKYLVLVENGTKDGFQIISEAREIVLQHSAGFGFKCSVLGPCPHDFVCPRLATMEPCNFLSNYRGLKVKKEEEFCKTPYSYIIFKKEARSPTDKQWPKVVKEVLKQSRHVHCELCTADGKLERIVVSQGKYDEHTYRCVRTLLWGDLFPGKVVYVKRGEPICKKSGDHASFDALTHCESCNDTSKSDHNAKLRNED